MRNKLFILTLGFLCIVTTPYTGWANDATSGMFFGGAAGTAAGAGIGYAIDRGPGGAILGAVIGGLLGSAVGRDTCTPRTASPKSTCATTGYYYNSYPNEMYCYSSNRAAMEQERRAKRAYERARYYELLAENERLRRELMYNDGCCTTEYHYTTIYR